MKKIKVTFPIILMLLTFLVACKTEKETNDLPVPEIEYPNYLPLKVGNYWIYRQFDIDAAGNATSSNRLDSCYIAKDTTIQQKKYYKLVSPSFYSNQPEVTFLRDSLHYLVNHKGRILFSSEDFTTIFSTDYRIASSGSNMNDTIVKITSQMADKDLLVSSPAGKFSTSNFKQTNFIYPGYRGFTTYRYLNTRYSENIGIVTESLPFFLSMPTSIERRLERYHLN